jgi:hypothetical protein
MVDFSWSWHFRQPAGNTGMRFWKNQKYRAILTVLAIFLRFFIFCNGTKYIAVTG